MAETQTLTIRLACSECSRDDMDGISQEQLDAAIRGGWGRVRQVQTYEESITVYDDPADAPPGYSVLDWFTHIGVCPECSKEGE